MSGANHSKAASLQKTHVSATVEDGWGVFTQARLEATGVLGICTADYPDGARSPTLDYLAQEESTAKQALQPGLVNHRLASTQQIGPRVQIHRCTSGDAYTTCAICPVFGVTSDNAFATPTRLIVRDLLLSNESATLLENARTELPYTEVKTEVAIDRITAASNPRDIERVPAGAVFSGLDLSFSVYEAADVKRFAVVAQAMALLEDDYLGGHGARGYGRIEFTGLKVTIKDYRRGSVRTDDRDYGSTYELAQGSDAVGSWINETLTPGRSV